jgi:hypothetical protein
MMKRNLTLTDCVNRSLKELPRLRLIPTESFLGMAQIILEAMAKTHTACSQSLPPLLIGGEGEGTSMGKKMTITIILTAERTMRRRKKWIV